MKHDAPLTALAAVLLASTPAGAEATRTGYVDANGLHAYYEVHGTGEPLFVLHGAYQSVEDLRPLIDGLAATRQVIALDLQGHGRTADVDRPLAYEGMADDVAALMDEIGIPVADVFGYSMGAGVAYQLAIRHPDHVDRLAAASGSFSSAGLYPEMAAMFEQMTPEAMAGMMEGTPYATAYRAVAPNPDAFPTLVAKLLALDTAPQDWPAADVEAIAAPTLVISGDSDIIRPEHSVEIFRLRGGGPSPDFMAPGAAQLAILPGTTHLGVIERTDLLVPMLVAFLDKPGE